MFNDSGLWATLAVVLPLAAAAPFVAAAAYIVVRLLKDSAPARAAASYGPAAEAYDAGGAAPLGTFARQVQEELLARDRAFEQLRRTGEGAPARILDLSDTGIRIGDGASMLRFGLEVLPSGRPAFRAETHCAVADASRPKFAPGSTLNVRFGLYGSPVVAVDHAP
jgi:hypothetical protein